MTNSIILILFKNLFANNEVRLPQGTVVLKTTSSGLRYYKLGRYLFIEQNPEKKSKYAELARKGHKIAWLIDTTTDEYLKRVIDGKIKTL
ncbi:hypothetical protein KAW50_03415 [candidate division WOR-3 bacterium]|nr:hypothetical protein [candidate division WOR-3 bacterium]